jgi:dinuclear metal center YbgI/SA1388 family protein
VNAVIEINRVLAYLDTLAPLELAEDWDNVGLLWGYRGRSCDHVLTCLTLTPDVAAEAIDRQVQLIVSHHPILFRAVQRLTDETVEGRMLLDLAAAGVAVYSPHTGYDSARHGINQQLAELFDLQNVAPLRPAVSVEAAGTEVPAAPDASVQPGAGRYGDLRNSLTLGEFIGLVKQRLGIERVQYVGEETSVIRRVGVACGSAAEFLRDARRLDCQVLLTGEARFHACLEARTLPIALVLPGHYASERPAVERLAERLAAEFPELEVTASQTETDPLKWD